VHHLQGEAERVTSAHLAALLRGFYADTSALRARHEANARGVGEYDFNNTYQYILDREDTHLTWLCDAIQSMGGAVPDAPADPAAPPAAFSRQGGAAVARRDAEAMGLLIAQWQDKLRGVTHARHRLMLDVILGEMREHQRFFELAAAGRTDLLGRRTGGSQPVGRVLATRWVE
jgi:hypothetical protein